MKSRIPFVAALALAALAPLAARAHHSFAVYFDPSKSVTITGKVTSFRFTNPHGTIVLDVTDAQGQVHEWRAETNAPVVLRRRGWTPASIKPGETITIDGWPSRSPRPPPPSPIWKGSGTLRSRASPIPSCSPSCRPTPW